MNKSLFYTKHMQPLKTSPYIITVSVKVVLILFFLNPSGHKILKPFVKRSPTVTNTMSLLSFKRSIIISSSAVSKISPIKSLLVGISSVFHPFAKNMFKTEKG